jgi:hypothetical protein
LTKSSRTLTVQKIKKSKEIPFPKECEFYSILLSIELPRWAQKVLSSLKGEKITEKRTNQRKIVASQLTLQSRWTTVILSIIHKDLKNLQQTHFLNSLSTIEENK